MNVARAPAPTISLCIPTYNRSACLDMLLASAATQAPPFDEIIVSDDASSDETPQIVARWAARLPQLRSIRLKVNGGLDANFRTVVEAATGDFIWFMGDDDRLRQGAVATARAALERHPAALGATVGVVDYDSRLEHPSGMRRRVTSRSLRGAEVVFSEIADLLGFMSCTLVRRSAWEEALHAKASTHDNLYSQVYRIGRMLGSTGEWLVIDDLLVDFRSDNDQFKAKLGGHFPRLLQDVDAYSDIFDDLFADAPQARHAADDLILKSHVLSRVRNARLADPAFPILRTYSLLSRRYGPHLAFWRSVVPALVAPRWALAFARSAYRRLLPTSGAAKARSFALEGATNAELARRS